jgi:hypothetical protein
MAKPSVKIKTFVLILSLAKDKSPSGPGAPAWCPSL